MMHDRNISKKLERFNAVSAQKLALCDRLETIADSLPNDVGRQACIEAAKDLDSLMERDHWGEEDDLFSTLKLLQGEYLIDIDRLRCDHVDDQLFAEDLAHVLLSYGAGRPAYNAETTRYMLRGFFQSLRRNIAHERTLSKLLIPEQAGDLNGKRAS